MARRKDGRPRSLPTDFTPLTKSGHCAFPSEGSHEYCQSKGYNCTCECHENFNSGANPG